MDLLKKDIILSVEGTSDANEILPKTVKFIRREIGGKFIFGNGGDQVILVVVRFR